MLSPRLAGRYAKSLVDISKEQNQLEKVYEDMLTLQSINKGSRDFLTLLRSPVVPSDKKKQGDHRRDGRENFDAYGHLHPVAGKQGPRTRAARDHYGFYRPV